MNKILLPVLLAAAAALGLPSPARSEQPATRAEFVAGWIAALEQSEHIFGGDAYDIEIVDELEIMVKTGGLTIRASGKQAYQEYLAAPAGKSEKIALLVNMVQEALRGARSAPDISRIVPLIKRSDWLAKYQLDCPYYALPGDLIVVLAEDRPDEVRYLRTDDLKRLDKPVPELFTAAIANLRKIAPIEEHDFGSFVVLSSGGTYEAGLMLDGDLIAGYARRFAGEIIFSVPAADVFVLTGRDDQQGLGGIVRAVCAGGADQPARLSSKVFAAGEGVLKVVGEVDCGGEQPMLTIE